MPTRHEQERQRLQLEALLEERIRVGELASGQILPSVRDLAETHGVSIHVTRQAVRSLESRGLLHTIERVGTFVGEATPIVLSPTPIEATDVSSGYFVMVVNGGECDEIVLSPTHAALRVGFENRIAEHGGTLLLMSAPQMLTRRSRGELPELRGVFDVAWSAQGPFWAAEFVGSRVPHVHIGTDPRSYGLGDTVSFDDEQGGALATRHLLAAGHTRIAFLGLHIGDEPLLSWSARREAGWRKAMSESHLSCDGLVCAPTPIEGDLDANVQASRGLDPAIQAQIAREAAAPLVARLRAGGVTAVVAANDATAAELLHLLETESVPTAQWPALVGFDADPAAGRHWFTSLRLPWDELGSCAADLLWARAQGLWCGAPQHREVPMRLIPRLSSRPQWRLRAAPLVESLSN
ncbi:hypothetical protein IAD21_06327 [Abditibacteriota bacterium]|nr:hypothetical protein IAD21_06327 [Abditibacteriota bacterium]